MRHLIALLLILLALNASAQDNIVTISFSAASLDSSINGLKYESNGKVEEINIFRGQRTTNFTYTGPPTLVFFKDGPSLGPGKGNSRIPLASCNIPKSARSVLMLFKHTGNKQRPYSIAPINDDLQGFSTKTYRFLNLTPFEIAIKLDGKVHRIEKKKMTDVKAGLSKNGHYKMEMISLPEDAEPVKVFKGFIYYSDESRDMYVISPRTGSVPGSVSFMHLPQTIPKQTTSVALTQ